MNLVCLTIGFRREPYPGTHAVADLLLAGETNPRSVAFQLSLINQHLAALPRDVPHPDHSYGQRVLLKMRSSIQLTDFVELCLLPVDGRHEQFHALPSGLLVQIDELSENIARLYFSHAVVSREIAGTHEEYES